MKHQASRILDNKCPIEPLHPLNLSLLDEWAAVPLTGWNALPTAVSTDGKLRSLVRGEKNPHDATYHVGSSGANPFSGWPHPGGPSGAYSFVNGINSGFGNTCVATLPQVDTAFSLAIWANPSSVSPTNNPLWDTRNNAGGNWFDFGFNGSTGLHGDVGTSTGTWITTSFDATLTITAGVWLRIMIAVNTTGGFISVNGSVRASFNWSGTPALTPASGTFQMAENTVASTTLQGNWDDCCLWTRKLSGAEAAIDYEESIAGNPNRWRWMKRAAWFLPPAGAAIPNRIVEVNQSITTAVY